jgi:hypothetical protein
VSKSKVGVPETLTVHKTVSTHLHPDLGTALAQVGHNLPLPPQSGIGQDPRKKFEDLHWTSEEKAGHDAYVKSVRESFESKEYEDELEIGPGEG